MAADFVIAKGIVEVETRYDGKTITRMSTRAGNQASKTFATAFGSRTSVRRFNKMWGAFFKPLNNLKTWLNRARLPALLGGIFGAVLAGIPTLAHLGSVVGVGMIPAMLSWASTIGIVRALLGNLSKSIKSQVLKQLNDASEAFKELAVETAKPGLNAFLEEAIEHTPVLNKYIKELAGHVSDVGFAMAKVLDQQTNMQRIRFTLDQTAQATGVWYGLLDEAAEVLIALASVGAPLFLRFTNQMERVALTIHDWVMLKTATGELAMYLHDAYQTLEKFGRAGRDFLIGLFNLINGGVFGAEKVADSLERWGASFREWTTHAANVEKVRKVIEWFTSHVDDLLRFAAVATAMSLAITAISKVKAPLMFVRTLLALGPVGFILFGIGAALASLASGFVLAYQRSEEFRDKLHDLVGEISHRLAPIFKDWYDWIKNTLLPLLEEGAIETLDQLVLAFRDVARALEDNQENLKELRPVFIALITVLGFFTRELVVNFVHAIAGAILILGAFGDGIKRLRETFFRLTDWVGDAVEWTVEKFGELKDKTGDAVDAIAEWFRLLPGRVMHFITSLPGRLGRLMVRVMEDMIYAVAWGLGKVVQFFEELPEKVLLWIVNTWDDVYTTTKRMIGKLVHFVSTLPERMTTLFFKTWESVLRTTTTWFKNIVDFVKKLPGRIITAIINLPEKLRSKFGESWQKSHEESKKRTKSIVDFVLKLPGRIFAGLGKLRERLVNRFAEGWAKATGTQKDKVKAIIDHVLGIPGRVFAALRQLAGKLISRAREGWQRFREAAGDKVNGIIVWVSQIPERIRKGLGSIGTKLRESGRQLLQGLLAGVQARIREIGGLGSWFKTNLVDPIVNAVRRFFQIASPSKVFQGIGSNIVAGLWKGMAQKNPKQMITKIFGGMDKALVSMVTKNLISLANLPLSAMKKLSGVFDDLFGGGGGSMSGGGGTIGYAANAWKVFAEAFGVPMGGYRAVGSVPGSDHPKHKAIDVMTSNPALHQMIIALGKALPGAKYWISMRQIATAAGGWQPRPYSGPSPHTDHVHWSFYRQGRHGRGLPEDVMGVGRQGLYQFHRGEQVLRQGETTNNSNVTHVTNYVTIDASNVREMNQVIDLLKGLQSNARQHGVPARARVA